MHLKDTAVVDDSERFFFFLVFYLNKNKKIISFKNGFHIEN
jgi:hypothetical protein